MSHSKERAEKICLNCRAGLHGRYCHQCGQENIEPKETFFHLVKHFFYDITHFDGKFFDTIKILLLKPGFLSKEYMAGKRASYLNPIRMYVFTSAFFFLIFFSIIKPEDALHLKVNETAAGLKAAIENGKNKLQEEINSKKEANDTAGNAKLMALLAAATEDLKLIEKDSTISPQKLKSLDWISGNTLNPDNHYKNLQEYDSLMNTLPKEKRDNWFEQLMTHKSFSWKEKYGSTAKAGNIIFEKFLHSIPQLLFVSLPFFAFFLKLLYIRRRKQFYYADHGIFSIHLYCAIFISLLLIFGINKIKEMLHWGWLGTVSGISIFLIFVYAFVAMKRFYSQGYIKTFFKYFILLFMVLILMAILMAVFLILSFSKV